MRGLLLYLVGVGKREEHENPHLVAGSPEAIWLAGERPLESTDAAALARFLDEPREAFGTTVTIAERDASGQMVGTELGGYIRYGVDDPNALILMSSGIRSRRLAHTIAQDLPEELPSSPDSLREFLAPMGVAGWRDRYTATASEILDLLEFARLRRRSLLRALLETGTVDVTLPTLSRADRFRQLTLEAERNASEPAPLALYDGNELIATIASQDHADVNEILETGVGTRLAINATADPPTLTIALTLRDVG